MATAFYNGTTVGGRNGTQGYSHAVSRSSELLSCAKTAVRVAKSQHEGLADNENGNVEQQWWSVDPNLLRLNDNINSKRNQMKETSKLEGFLEDGTSLLRTMQACLEKLQGLVRRRGHTNDPTQEIALATQQLEADAKELQSVVTILQQYPIRRSSHHKKHIELMATWLQTVAAQQTSKLKNILRVRGDVLAEQAQRRKLLNSQGGTAKPTGGATSTITPVAQVGGGAASSFVTTNMALESPLFTTTGGNNASKSKRRTPSKGSTLNGYPNGNGTNARPGYGSPYGGYGGAGGGYGGMGGSYGQMGMRQRRGGNNNQTSTMQQAQQDDASAVQSQIQQRQQQRQTQNRLEDAKQAESKLAELGTMFTKMSSLIVKQGETLEKLEDDVEAAVGHVTQGQEEIQKLHGMKKGNRSLIIKVFGILIFFIVLLRFY